MILWWEEYERRRESWGANFEIQATTVNQLQNEGDALQCEVPLQLYSTFFVCQSSTIIAVDNLAQKIYKK